MSDMLDTHSVVVGDTTDEGHSLLTDNNTIGYDYFNDTLPGVIGDTIYEDRNAYKATVSGLSTHSAGDVYDYFITGDREDQFKAGLSTLSDSLRAALGDSLQTLLSSYGFALQSTVDSVLDTTSVISEIFAAIIPAIYEYFVYEDREAPFRADSVVGWGSGAYSCSLRVVDTSDNGLISGARVTVQNQTETLADPLIQTAVHGLAVFNLDNGDYRYLGNHGLYIVGQTDFTVSDAARMDTLCAYSPYISTAPDASNLATVYGYVYRGNGDPVIGADVYFVLSGAAVDSTTWCPVAPAPIYSTTDGTGKFEVALLKTGNLIPGTYFWEAQITHSSVSTPVRLSFGIDRADTLVNVGEAIVNNGFIR